jgi:hypothetical protein
MWGNPKNAEQACRPDSVRQHAGATIIHLGVRLPARSSHRPARSDGPPCADRAARVPIGCCSGWGLACQPCRQGRGELLPRRFTLTVARDESHALRRCTFCSTVRHSQPFQACHAWPLASTLSCGVRTFLPQPRLHTATGDRPACSAHLSYAHRGLHGAPDCRQMARVQPCTSTAWGWSST